MMFKRLFSVMLSISFAVLSFSGCAGKETVIPDEEGWFCAWGAASQPADDEQLPKDLPLNNNTCRQVIRPAISGNKLTLTFSNEYGDIPITFEKVHIAKLLSAGSPDIDAESDTEVTFGGSGTVKIEGGKTAVSDEIDFEFEAFELLAVSFKIGKYTGGTVTCHKEALSSCWISEGDCVSDPELKGVKVMGCWYYLNRMDVWSEAGTRTLVVLGDSISDGVGASANLYSSWPDKLAEMLSGNPDTRRISVVNMGISGNVLTGEWGDTAKNRLERDVLSVSGARYCILLIGINDIGGAQSDISESIISDYKQIIQSCHERGIKVYAGTLTPTKGNLYYSELHEKIRLEVNKFIMSDGSGFDGVIDFSSAIASDDDPSKMKDEYNCPWGDYLHPGDKGYERMAVKAYETLTGLWAQQQK